MSTFAASVMASAAAQEPSNKTEAIYSLIRDKQYADAIRILNVELQSYPNSRAALSLLGYCYYHTCDFESAAGSYEQLCRLCPDQQQYLVYWANSLYKGGFFPEALRAAQKVTNEQYAYEMLALQSAIKYEMDDLAGARSFVSKCVQDDPNTIVSRACIHYKEGDYEKALELFTEALNQLGFQADIVYNIALCYYQLNEYPLAIKHYSEIVSRGDREHPELHVGANMDGESNVRSVGNSQTLKETALIEAFNLKAAIEFKVGNPEGAREALSYMPPREESELDPVTLHNTALMHMDDEPETGFEKLNFLITRPPFPPETFGNLLLLYCKYQFFDTAADVLADNTHLHASCLTPELYAFLEAMIMAQAEPAEAFRKFELLSKTHTDTLRLLNKQMQEARQDHDQERLEEALTQYDEALERYLPVLMAQAKIYWDIENYPMVERVVFQQAAEFCDDNETWKLNVAHIFFMQGKYKEAIRYYEPIVRDHFDSILDVTAIVLANLCVSFIMTSQNVEAEELMKQIEREEERLAIEQPDRNTYHLCIVNIVIGTLYCSKANFDFGISRVIKSLEPLERKLGPDTWYYAKRCFLALLENIAKQMITFPDGMFAEILDFLSACERHGAHIRTRIKTHAQSEVDPSVHNVAFEARQLKRLFLLVQS